VKIERREPATRQLAQPRYLAGCGKSHHLNRLRRCDTLQLGRCDWWLEKDHRMDGYAPKLSARDVDRFVVVVIAEGA
jgi:hypothetical protein